MPPYVDVINDPSYTISYFGNGNQQCNNGTSSCFTEGGLFEVTAGSAYQMQLNPPFTSKAYAVVTGIPASAVTSYRVNTGPFANCGANASCLTVNGTPTTLAAPATVTATDQTTGGTCLPNTTYSYKVVSVDMGAFPASPFYGYTTPSTAASVTTANDGHSTHSILVSWSLVLGAFWYEVFGRTTASYLNMTPTPLPDSQYGYYGGTLVDDCSVTPSGAVPVSNTATGVRFTYHVTGF